MQRDFAKELQKEFEMRFVGSADYRNSVWKILIEHYFQKVVGDDHVNDVEPEETTDPLL